MTRRLPLLGLVGAAVVLALTACGPASHPTLEGVETREVVTATGTILVPASPKRVVALDGAPAALDGSSVVLVGDDLGALLDGDVDVAAVADLEPDLILAALPADALDDSSAVLGELREIAPVAVFTYEGDDSRLEVGIELAAAAGVSAQLSQDRIAEATALVDQTGYFADRAVALAPAEGESTVWVTGLLESLGASVVGIDEADVVLAADPVASVTAPTRTTVDGMPAAGVITLDPAGPERAIAVLAGLLLVSGGAF